MVIRSLPFALNLPAWSRLASQCAVCRSWPARQVCADCLARFDVPKKRCPGCALAWPAEVSSDDLPSGQREPTRLCGACLKQAPPVDETLVAVDYAYPWSELVTRYKFGERPGWAAFFAQRLLAAPGVARALAPLRPGDLILPMPLSAQRLQARGFNQSWELASALHKQSGSQARAEALLLLRVQDTPPQTELSREARLANVRSAFQVDPLRAGELAGRRVMLVDDVMTSGASLFTAAASLRAAGAAHITALAFARTAAP